MSIVVQLLHEKKANSITVELKFSARVRFVTEVSEAIRLFIDDAEISNEVLELKADRV